MCGIYGLIAKRGPLDRAALEAGTRAVAHRGPDGSGVWIEGPVGLGHTRLSILDVADTGAQPMRHRSLPLTLVFNGEIYNYLELRAELAAKGHAFVGGSDSEVLLAAYVEWGEGCVSRFNGMWGFAIFDGRSNVVFCARDRFGVKPFYFVDTPACFAFGSEIRQLLPHLAAKRMRREAVEDFLVCGLSDHDDGTFFSGVAKLPAGHTMSIDIESGARRLQRYYVLAPASAAASLDRVSGPASLKALLEDAVRLRLRSDVRVGTCLSGGLDSSSVASLASELNRAAGGEPFRAITAVSEDEATNEEAFAAQVVQASGLDWIRVRPDFEDFAASVDDVIDTQEEPFGGPSIFMQYFVMQAARKAGVKVLLDGQGGDETLLGYERYYPAWLMAQFREGGLSGFARAAREAVAANANVPPLRLGMYLLGVGSPWVRDAAYRFRYRFLHAPKLPAALSRFGRASRDALAMQRIELLETNLPMLLRFEDKNSMRFGVEARLPFLDYRLVEFALGLPLSLKLQGGWTKWTLREAMADRLPETITWRRNKFGFNAPDARWLARHHGPMRETILRSPLVAEFADVKGVVRGFERIDRGMRWRLFCLARWAERFGVLA